MDLRLSMIGIDECLKVGKYKVTRIYSLNVSIHCIRVSIISGNSSANPTTRESAKL